MDRTKQIKEFLGSVEQARQRYRAGVLRVEELTRRCKEAEGRGEEAGAVQSLARQRAALSGLYQQWEEQEERVGRFLDGVEDPRYRAILRLRYVELLRWPKVQEELEKGGIFYSERQVFNLHRQALAEAGRRWINRTSVQ